MSARPVTDDQIARALRAHLPEQAAPGLRARVMDETATTSQVRSFPSFLGALGDADPVGRRRNLLLAAALLVALALASTATVGALRLLQQERAPELNVEPPADLPAFVMSSDEGLLQLPPVAFTWQTSDAAKGRVYVDRSGAVRFDRFTSAEATAPSGTTILSDNRISGMVLVDSHAVWIEPGHEAIDDNPREYLHVIFDAGGGPGCEMAPDPEGGNPTAATGWRYVGAEDVAGRPTHHLACVVGDSRDTHVWLDVETRLILRTREPLTDEADQPIPGRFATTEVTEIAFGEQPPALFGPPEGVPRMSEEAYIAYICERDLPNELVFELFGISESCPTPDEAEATPEPTPTPTPTVRPSPDPRPSGSADPFAWSEASLTEDWPAPVRPEPLAGASVQPILLDCCERVELGRYLDPTDDSGSVVIPWVDLNMVSFCGTKCLQVWVPTPPPDVDPTEQWIAYGLVVDDDGDGVADRRMGIENGPLTAEGVREPRTWITDLHTGRTESEIGDPYGLGLTLEGTSYPVTGADDPNGSPDCSAGAARLEFFGGDIAGGGTFSELPERFYAWASMIDRGRVAATDYAPDTGWLKPSSKAPPSAPDSGEAWMCPPTTGVPGR